ncbi:MAG: hypothetical protein KDA37_15620 [Planctomycetales bacterium]|nr:hypothetical protein [Planctomycetales bacterium]
MTNYFRSAENRTRVKSRRTHAVCLFAPWRLPLGLVLALVGGGLAGAQPPAELPLSRVVVFNTGVAFFEHAGTVSGDQTVNLGFEPDEINDVLKSLVLLDLDGGKASTVTYDNREPLARTLASLSVDLSSNTTMADLLRQLRGQEVMVEEEFPRKGRIVGVEQRQTPIRDTSIERDFLLLRTNEGLMAIALDKVRTLRLLDEKLDADFQKALELLAGARSSQQKRVTLSFRGEGDRHVRAGYIREFPIWKTSYRLVLDEDNEPLLQGWAIVENTTTSDWRNVDLSLVSGRPITFLMQLYEPLYVQRPKVSPELFAGVAPRVYDQDLGEPLAETAPPAPARGRPGGMGGGGGAFGGGAAFAGRGYGRQAGVEKLSGTLGSTQQVMSEAGDVGELFRYHIDVPVSLASERSAMLPIVGEKVKCQRLAIYNPQVHAKHPLSGLRLTNSTELHLMQGPITVFDAGEFAGDARIADIPPAGERLVSYALDLETEIVTRPVQAKQRLLEAKLNGLALVLKHRLTRGLEYAIKNSHGKPRELLIEQPITPGWELSEPAAAEETTRDTRRFRVEVAPQETVVFHVKEQLVQEQAQSLTSISDRQISQFVEAPEVPAGVKEVLKELVSRREKLAETKATIKQATDRVAEITKEQERIRKNMEGLERTSALYTRYAQKLNEQETEIEKLRETIAELSEQANQQEKDLLSDLSAS